MARRDNGQREGKGWQDSFIWEQPGGTNDQQSEQRDKSFCPDEDDDDVLNSSRSQQGRGETR